MSDKKEKQLYNDSNNEVQEQSVFFEDYIKDIVRPIDDISNEHIAEEYFEGNINKHTDEDFERDED